MWLTCIAEKNVLRKCEVREVIPEDLIVEQFFYLQQTSNLENEEIQLTIEQHLTVQVHLYTGFFFYSAISTINVFSLYFINNFL